MTCGQSPVAITGTSQIVSAVTGTAQVAVAVECCPTIAYDPVYVSWLPIDEEIKSSLKRWSGATFVSSETVSRTTVTGGGGGGSTINPGGFYTSGASPTDEGGGGINEM